ncbi:Fe-S cluster assembly sulfur transfer protein SufU [Glycomyces algeriensis]|uniref:Iron-sulfur cluster assembly scaffold protein NifU n=1 Tax=Glycomyces algeriensis TaxID=256037 RepID=A0A9W6GCC9_9ACTN|nr:SUF system NifU family Fe-S cluster assembly protein [Glycomyces algeriensis]MDA1365833.1 SUF system NifU family Fe-S cluster assembly protein [Glycomyces algeriensis]MDR7351522.1 nitrogen fixation NifU-like protein [Glycomyces algeriensis]GLI44242.1 iron-sulfur cluster assembly scaffold protein NifU [Glycomyces algeriensis]
MNLDELYQEVILDHYKRPRGAGLREPYEGESHQVNPTCGDEITLRVHVEDGKVADVSYDNVGCSISKASASVMYELINGTTVNDALAKLAEFTELMNSKGQSEGDEDSLEDAVAFAGVSKYPMRVKCALLGWMAFKDALVRAEASIPGRTDA